MTAPRRAVSRRGVLSWLVPTLALATAACGRARIAAEPALPPAAAPRAIDPVADLVPAAGLVWLVEMSPRALAASPVTGAALATIVTDERLRAFADRHGGVDLRQTEQLVIAAYPRATLALARVAFDPERVEAAFAARAGEVEGRAVARGVTRVWGSVGGEREQVAMLAGEVIAVERGELGPLQAAVYFAQGRLHRSRPALQAAPLSDAAALAGSAPVRAFAPRPFEGPWAGGLAGLLGATTAVAAAMRPVARASGAALAVEIVLTGGWGDDAPAAAARLLSAFDVLATDPLARLTGMDRPVEGPRVSGDAGALRLDVTLDATALARGVRAATGATLDEIMSY
jgi:hypothetical protein